jgi:predicted RND superfamily exporter protein
MYARVTNFFKSVAESRGFQFSVGMIIGIIVCILFVFYVLPKLLKNKHLP